MLCLFAFGLETPTHPMVASVVIIAAGTALAAYGEVQLNTVGLAIMLVSAVSESLRLVMTQYLLVGLKMGPIEGLMYLGPACFVWLAAGGAAMEYRRIAATSALRVAGAHWGLFVAAACMGFVINVLAFATIKLASSLTLKVCVWGGALGLGLGALGVGDWGEAEACLLRDAVAAQERGDEGLSTQPQASLAQTQPHTRPTRRSTTPTNTHPPTARCWAP